MCSEVNQGGRWVGGAKSIKVKYSSSRAHLGHSVTSFSKTKENVSVVAVLRAVSQLRSLKPRLKKNLLSYLYLNPGTI